MTKQTNPAQRSLCALIANDAYAMTFQSLGHYRAALLQQLEALALSEPSASTALTRQLRRISADSSGSDHVTVSRQLLQDSADKIERYYGGMMAWKHTAEAETPVAEQAAARGALLEILRDVHDTLASDSDSDIDHFEDNEEEREGAPVQYAARKVMQVMDMLKSAPSAPGTPEAPQTAAARDVLAERQRQMEVEGWTLAHDDNYRTEQLRFAALCYMRWKDITQPGVVPGAWPWAENGWKPADDRRNMVKATALMVAEIERLDRAAAPEGGA